MFSAPTNPAYGLLMLMGLGLSAWFWSRMYRTRAELVMVYAFGLLCAFVGAKVLYIVAEAHVMIHTEGKPWWADPLIWQQLLVGKTILGALLGGYAGVELGKWAIAFREPTGDTFALMVPLGISIGRIGCLLHGCCLGVACDPAWYTVHDAAGIAHYAAAGGELAFNLTAAAALFALYRAKCFRHQLFHLYLIAYGLFRFFHEFARATPRWTGGSDSGGNLPAISAYQVFALLLVAFAVWRFFIRRDENKSQITQVSAA